MSNSFDQDPQGLVRELQTSSPARVAADHSNEELGGRSQAFIEVMKQVDRASNTNLPVLLTGAAGSGKQLVACAIHHRSSRSDQPFIAFNCSTVPSHSIAAELFGGPIWDEAGGGTLFLDEITAIDSSLQLQLLHALQTGEIERAGSNERQKVDVRLIAASSRNLEQEVAAEKFHGDLFQQLSAISIVLPPLRRIQVENTSEQEPDPNQAASEDWVTLSEIEGRYVARVLRHTGGNKQAAARVLSVDRKTLDRMIKRHHIDSHSARRQGAKVSATS